MNRAVSAQNSVSKACSILEFTAVLVGLLLEVFAVTILMGEEPMLRNLQNKNVRE